MRYYKNKVAPTYYKVNKDGKAQCYTKLGGLPKDMRNVWFDIRPIWYNTEVYKFNEVIEITEEELFLEIL